GRKHHLPYRNFHGLPTTPSRRGALAWTDEGAGGTVAQFAGPDQRWVRHRQAFFGDRRFIAGVVQRRSFKRQDQISSKGVSQKNEKSASDHNSRCLARSVPRVFEEQS